MDIDQSRCHIQTCSVDRPARTCRFDGGVDSGDLAIADGDVAGAIDTIGGVDYVAANQKQVEIHQQNSRQRKEETLR